MIYSVQGKSAGRLASLLNLSIKHPVGAGNTRFDKNVKRKGNEHCPKINYGLPKNYIKKSFINYHAENASDKLFCFECFDERGIPHPKIINPDSYDGYFLGRRNFGSRGDGIVKFKPRSESYKRNKHFYDFCVEFIESVGEYRIHVWGHQIIIETEKDFTKNTHPFIRNSVYGSVARPSFIRHPKRLEILDAAISAVESVKLDFAAVDIMIGKDNRYYILECNSAPLLIGVNTYLYAEHLANKYNLNYKKWWLYNRDYSEVIDLSV